LTIKKMRTHLQTLDNTLRTAIIDTGGSETATVLLLVGAGSRYENLKNNGIAHFFEHMAFKGSNKYPDSFAISSTIDEMGGIFNAFTAKDHTGYWIKGPSDKIGLMLDVLSDMVITAKLDEGEIEKEKGVIVEEINMYEDMPHHKVATIYDKLLFADNPLGMDIAGTHSTVRSFGRKDFIEYIGKYYHPDNSVLLVCGGLDGRVKAIQKQLQNTFGQWQRESSRMGDYAYPHFIQDGQKSELVSVFHKKTEQTHFILGYTTDYGFMDSRKYALKIISAILGGGMSSKLFMEVREKRGLCYYINTSSDLYSEVGSIATSAGVKCDSKSLNEAIEVILQEHQKIATTRDLSILSKDLARVKQMIKGRVLLSLEDSQNVASFYGDKILLEGHEMSPDDVISRLEAVTEEDVVHEARSIVDQKNLKIAVVGPFEKSDIKIAP
jgi:predicted Zn-dependent peptidase